MPERRQASARRMVPVTLTDMTRSGSLGATRLPEIELRFGKEIAGLVESSPVRRPASVNGPA